MAEVEKAIEAIVKVIDNSSAEVLMVSGALANEVYQSQRIQDTITKALERGAKFDIIVGPRYDTKSSFILSTLRNVICVAAEWPERHFVVGDRRHIRYEPRHDEKEGLPAAANMVARDMPEAAQYLAARFQELKSACEPIKQQEKTIA